MEWAAIDSLVCGSQDLLNELRAVYQHIPPTTCRRRAKCCSLLPETSFVEFLHLYQTLGLMPDATTRSVLAKIAAYYLLNSVERLDCPFLDSGSCLIYGWRPFTCRAYGLWSQRYYDEQAARNRQGKEACRAGWKSLGIDLPEEVLNFSQGYCLSVTSDAMSADDGMLNAIWTKILELGEPFEPLHSRYVQEYFSDFSFAMTALALGYRRALVEKVNVAREVVTHGDKKRVDSLVQEILQKETARLRTP